MFTKTEETILNALPPKYKYIFRSRGGNLRISERFDGIDDYLIIPPALSRFASESRFLMTLRENT